MTSVEFPPLQNPASYNLDQVMQQVREKCESRGRIAGVEQPRRSLRTPSWGVLRELDEVTATLLGVIAMSGYDPTETGRLKTFAAQKHCSFFR